MWWQNENSIPKKDCLMKKNIFLLLFCFFINTINVISNDDENPTIKKCEEKEWEENLNKNSTKILENIKEESQKTGIYKRNPFTGKMEEIKRGELKGLWTQEAINNSNAKICKQNEIKLIIYPQNPLSNTIQANDYEKQTTESESSRMIRDFHSKHSRGQACSGGNIGGGTKSYSVMGYSGYARTSYVRGYVKRNGTCVRGYVRSYRRR
jgi:hypothetical protein